MASLTAQPTANVCTMNEVIVEGVAIPIPDGVDIDAVQNMAAIRRMKVRSDDVMISAMLKAGTHWAWEIVSMLVKGKAEHEPLTKEANMIEFNPVSNTDRIPSPRVLNTHLLYRFLPQQSQEKKTKIIYIIRNPKDIAVSLYHHDKSYAGKMAFKGTLSDYLRQKFLVYTPSIWNYFFATRDWERAIADHPDHPILQLSYEDMKEDLPTQVRRLAKFLEVAASEELICQVAEACSFASLKATDRTKRNTVSHLFQPGYSMYRKGQVGDWKNWFTVADNEMFDEFYKTIMEGSKQEFRFTL